MSGQMMMQAYFVVFRVSWAFSRHSFGQPDKNFFKNSIGHLRILFLGWPQRPRGLGRVLSDLKTAKQLKQEFPSFLVGTTLAVG